MAVLKQDAELSCHHTLGVASRDRQPMLKVPNTFLYVGTLKIVAQARKAEDGVDTGWLQRHAKQAKGLKLPSVDSIGDEAEGRRDEESPPQCLNTLVWTKDKWRTRHENHTEATSLLSPLTEPGNNQNQTRKTQDIINMIKKSFCPTIYYKPDPIYVNAAEKPTWKM